MSTRDEYPFSKAEFLEHRKVQRGRHNPERLDNPYYLGAIRERIGPFEVAEHFGFKHRFPVTAANRDPTWTFHARMGMSCTLTPRNDLIFIGGEHEDWYDPDFAIYNDVIVKRWDGSIEVYGYPTTEFEPTDFHSATLIGSSLFIIGGIGYQENRIFGTTPVYELDLKTMHIERLEGPGVEPGWISRHAAIPKVKSKYENATEIIVIGGEIMEGSAFRKNNQAWTYHIESRIWTSTPLLFACTTIRFSGINGFKRSPRTF